MTFINKVLERELNEINPKSDIRIGTIGGASIEIDNSSYIYNGPNQIKDRDEDFENLLEYFGF